MQKISYLHKLYYRYEGSSNINWGKPSPTVSEIASRVFRRALLMMSNYGIEKEREGATPAKAKTQFQLARFWDFIDVMHIINVAPTVQRTIASG